MNEKYIPLYRKYRPQKLEEVVGQTHIKQALTNAIAMNKISHAYLFTGPRGTGKTSTARIFAKSLNCVEGPTVNPCGVCENCRDITNSVPMDVIEIDAASNRKVEDAQNILEKVMYAPVNSRFKIYIIDEVHMLSTTAFNALLKTLEEPPENVIFILATTEVHKVLDTIKSRCQRFDFRRITTQDIVKHLRFISDAEKINITDDALATIAKNSAGGMRDSIALLDQLSVLGSQNAITTDDINSLLGRISFDVLLNLSSKIISSNPAEAIEVLEKIYNSGNEPVQILQNLLDYFKNLLIVKNCKREIAIDLTQLNDMQITDLVKQAQEVETHQIISLSEKCASYIKELKLTNNPRLWLEIAIVDMANLAENTKLADLQSRLSALESGSIVRNASNFVSTHALPEAVMQKTSSPVVNTAPISKQVENSLQDKNMENQKTYSEPNLAEKSDNQTAFSNENESFSPMPKSKAVGGADVMTLWANLLSNVKSPPAHALLKQWAQPVKLASDEVIITVKNEIYLNQFVSGSKRAVLQKAVDEMFSQTNTPINVRLPQAGDEEILKRQAVEKKSESVPVESAKVVRPVPKPKETVPSLQDVEDDIKASEGGGEVSSENALEDAGTLSHNGRRFEDMHSDTVNMVMDLFDGKIID